MNGFSLSVSMQKLLVLLAVLGIGSALVFASKLDATNLVAFVSGLVAALPMEDRKSA